LARGGATRTLESGLQARSALQTDVRRRDGLERLGTRFTAPGILADGSQNCPPNNEASQGPTRLGISRSTLRQGFVDDASSQRRSPADSQAGGRSGGTFVTERADAGRKREGKKTARRRRHGLCSQPGVASRGTGHDPRRERASRQRVPSTLAALVQEDGPSAAGLRGVIRRGRIFQGSTIRRPAEGRRGSPRLVRGGDGGCRVR